VASYFDACGRCAQPVRAGSRICDDCLDSRADETQRLRRALTITTQAITKLGWDSDSHWCEQVATAALEAIKKEVGT
jgi:hypothetical protein